MKKDNFVQLDSYDTNIPRQDDDEVGGKVEEKELLATMPNKASKDCTNSAEGQGTRAHLSHGCVKPISVRLAAPAGLAKDDEVTEKQIEIEDDEENTTQDSKEEKMSGLGKDDRVVPQTSLSRSQARCHPSLPGAHAVTGPEAEEEISRQQQRASQNLIETIISASTASPRPPPCRSPSPSTYASPAPEMVEARKVQDLDCPQNIPSAEPVFHDCNTKVQPSRKKRTPVLYTFIALALALAIGIGIAFCLRKDEDTDTSSTNSNHQSPTASPTQAFTYHAETMNLPESTLDAIIFGSELDPKTPQSRAYDWLMNDPFLADYPPWRQVQRFALTTFYYATGGEKWKLQKDWLSYNVSECQWYFRTLLWSEILIGSPTHVLNVGQLGQSELQFADRVCNEAGRYLHLVFAENNMKGFLPPEIALLNSLEVLDIGGNEFMIGSIPTEIGLLTRLTSFYAGYNSHTGHIPTEIGMLTRLEEM